MLKLLVLSVDVGLIGAAFFLLLRRVLAAWNQFSVALVCQKVSALPSEMWQWFSPEVMAALREHLEGETHGAGRMRATGRTLLFAVQVPAILRDLAQAEHNPRTQTVRDGIADAATLEQGADSGSDAPPA